MSTESVNSKSESVALAFANALVKRDFSSAYEMLSESNKKRMTPTTLQEEFESVFTVYKDQWGEDAAEIIDLE